jgi:YidC/Oxa1 family membrane protein insertase
MDLGIAVILFTIIIKFILYPLSKSSVITQIRMKELEPEINKLKSQYANDKQAQALKIMALYKEKKVKPFAGVLLIIIQLPILLALISVFYKIIPTIHAEFLYSFVSVPATLHTNFLGIDLTQKSLVLAIITGLIQFAQMHFSPAMRQNKNNPTVSTDMATQMASSMSKQMKYTMPVLAFISIYWFIPAGFPQAASIVAIYWITSSLFTLAQELYIRKQHTNTIKN